MNDDRKEVNIDSGNGFCWAAIPAQEQEKKADDIILTREAIISGLNKIAEIITEEFGDFSIIFITTVPGRCLHFSSTVSAKNILFDAAKTIEKLITEKKGGGHE